MWKRYKSDRKNALRDMSLDKPKETLQICKRIDKLSRAIALASSAQSLTTSPSAPSTSELGSEEELASSPPFGIVLDTLLSPGGLVPEAKKSVNSCFSCQIATQVAFHQKACRGQNANAGGRKPAALGATPRLHG